MSIKVMSQVWEHSTHKGSELITLLAIADYANDDGIAFPSVGNLAKKSRMTDRNVQFVITKLEKSQELSITRNAGPHGCHLYQVTLGEKISDEKFSPHKSVRGEKISDEKLSGVKTFRGEKIGGGGEIAISPDPSLDPSEDLRSPSLPSGELSPTPKKSRGGQPKREYSPGFQQFIDAYPRGRVTSKPTCYATWTRHNLEPRTDELIEKIERLKLTNWQDEYPRFVPYSMTWFKEQRWEDDLVALPSPLERLRGKERRTAEVTLRILQEGETGGRPRHARVLHRA